MKIAEDDILDSNTIKDLKDALADIKKRTTNLTQTGKTKT